VVRAPPLAGLYGKPVPLADGSIARADDQYIHDSIMLPNKQVAAGYKPIMPPFGEVLDEEQVAQLEAYIRSLGGEGER
jgi:cytochrome c oxidase subunit 2